VTLKVLGESLRKNISEALNENDLVYFAEAANDFPARWLDNSHTFMLCFEKPFSKNLKVKEFKPLENDEAKVEGTLDNVFFRFDQKFYDADKKDRVTYSYDLYASIKGIIDAVMAKPECEQLGNNPLTYEFYPMMIHPTGPLLIEIPIDIEEGPNVLTLYALLAPRVTDELGGKIYS